MVVIDKSDPEVKATKALRAIKALERRGPAVTFCHSGSQQGAARQCAVWT
jgi:hypothetical protein